MLSPDVIRWIFGAVIILVLSICVHEWGHAVMADKLGDPTPRGQGRVSLNPFRHADPIGTFVFPLIALVLTRGGSLGFGWGKPVQVQPYKFTRRFSMRTGHMFVALAGPAMNVVLGLTIAIVHVLLLKYEVIPAEFGNSPIPTTMNEVLLYAVLLNFILFFFNLIPAPPLDGGAVVEGLLPSKWVPNYQRFAVYGPFILMAVIFVPGLARVFVGPAYWCRDGLYQGLIQLFGVG